MKLAYLVRLIGLTALLSPTLVAETQTTETDWLKIIEGYQEETMGAQVRSVENDDETGTRKLIISIPKIAIQNPDAMEEVLVVGQKPEERGPMFDFKYETEWVDDYDKDHYGLIIRLGNQSNWPIRLYMRSDEGYQR